MPTVPRPRKAATTTSGRKAQRDACASARRVVLAVDAGRDGVYVSLDEMLAVQGQDRSLGVENSARPTRSSTTATLGRVPVQACPFCGSFGVKSKEHRIPQSWKQYFHLVSEIVRGTSVAGEVQPPRSSSRTQFDEQYAGICAVCNNGWMKEIDEAAMRRLVNLAWARTTTVPASEIVVVMRSVVRAALVTAWGTRSRLGYPASAFSEFYRRRLPPAGTRVFMGYSDWPFIHAAGHHSVLPMDKDIIGGVHIVAWSLQKLYIVVVFPRDDDQVMAGITATAIRRRSRGILRQVWPHATGRPIHVPISLSRELDRTFAASVTQARPLLLNDDPVVFTEDPPHLAARYACMSAEELVSKYLISPSAPVPPLAD